MGLRLGTLLLLATVGCTTPRTEILVVTDTDFAVPGELDEMRIVVLGPGGETQSSIATLGPGQAPPPRTLGLVHDGGRLGPFVVRVDGSLRGIRIVERVAEVHFQPQRTLILHMDLTRSCAGVSCQSEETCASGSCRSIVIEPDELEPFTGQLPGSDASIAPAADSGPSHDSGSVDAGSPVDSGDCGPEVCNGMDDDCDGRVDEDFDLDTDPSNCGSCGHACTFANGSGACEGGTCTLQACDAGFDDCDGDPANGCEADLTSAQTCGSCSNRCMMGAARQCCDGACQSAC
jgi:hypothetical protein